MVQVESICILLCIYLMHKEPQKLYWVWNSDIFILRLGLKVVSKYHYPGWIYGLWMPWSVSFWGLCPRLWSFYSWPMGFEGEKAPESIECVLVVKGYDLRQQNWEKRPYQFLLPRKAICCFDNSNVPLAQSYQLSKQVAVHIRLIPFHYREADSSVTESK